MSDLTHVREDGSARMVDVSAKETTLRRAVATGIIRMERNTLDAIARNDMKKGDVLGVARIAGIMAAKRTADLIPLCHPIPLDLVDVELEMDESLPGVRVRATVTCAGRTGVEMEALVAASTTLLTIYDMAKAVDRGMEIGNVSVLEKSGGRSGEWKR
jgi:cyclic pyranopterin phosphate synthase